MVSGDLFSPENDGQLFAVIPGFDRFDGFFKFPSFAVFYVCLDDRRTVSYPAGVGDGLPDDAR